MSMTLRLPPDLNSQLAAYCVATGSTMSGVLREALDAYLAAALAADPALAGRVAAIRQATP